MGLSASEQCVIFAWNVLFKKFFLAAQSLNFFQTHMFHVLLKEVFFLVGKYVLVEWGYFFTLKRIQTGCFD